MIRRVGSILAAAIVLALAGAPALAQLPGLPGLPPVNLPATPPIVDDTVNALPGAPRALRDLRKQRLDALLRANRNVIDTDRAGALVLREEALALSPTPQALARAQAEGFQVSRRTQLDGMDMEIVVLRAPRGMSTRQALERLRQLDPSGTYDFNHLYDGAGEPGVPMRGASAAPETIGGSSSARIGLIDGGVDARHPVFAGNVVSKAFAGVVAPSAHGTAVASLIAGRGDGFTGAAPGARLYAADVFGGVPTGGSAEAIAAALSWMVKENVRVVNISVVGPPNKTMEFVVRALVAKGVTIVAAVGNDGPAAPALYPASYPGVIGVTGVDPKRKAIVEAARGAQVDFAAPGSELLAARIGGGYARVRGTSYAAPIVAGLIASRGEKSLAGLAVDLGAKGKDKVFGYGLVGESLRADPRLIAARTN